MRPVSITKSLITPSVSCIAQGQSVAAGGDVILNGTSVVAGVAGSGPFGATVTQAVLDTQRRVAIVSSGNDSANSAHIYGLRGTGQPINEVLDLTNGGTAVSALDYQNVSTISLASATAGTITVGTNGTGSTDWLMPNFHLTPFNMAVADQVTGTLTWTMESTQDTYWSQPTGIGYTTPVPNVGTIEAPGSVAVGITLTEPVTGYRFTISAGTGTLAAQATQAGVVNY